MLTRATTVCIVCREVTPHLELRSAAGASSLSSSSTLRLSVSSCSPGVSVQVGACMRHMLHTDARSAVSSCTVLDTDVCLDDMQTDMVFAVHLRQPQI